MSSLIRIGTALHHCQLPMAASAVALVWVGAALLGRPLVWPWYAAALFGTWAIYLRDAAGDLSSEDDVNVPGRARFLHAHARLALIGPPILLTLAVISVAFVGPSVLRPPTLTVLIGMALLGGGYVLRAAPTPSGPRRLKDFALLKPFLISFAWVMGAVALPLAAGEATNRGPAAPVWTVALFLFGLLVVDSMVLDWRDRAGDAAAGLRTLAVRLSPGAWWRLTLGLTLLCGPIWMWGVLEMRDTRWLLGGGVMWFALLNNLLVLPAAAPREVLFSLVVMAWRFAGALVLLAVEP